MAAFWALIRPSNAFISALRSFFSALDYALATDVDGAGRHTSHPEPKASVHREYQFDTGSGNYTIGLVTFDIPNSSRPEGVRRRRLSVHRQGGQRDRLDARHDRHDQGR
jgi:hypothetical protein